ncbi:hypothetical protein EDB86DRAFT_3108625 [Lactarius hatsudake]|nr:hypothetical protein EDB86DRAFT_3108625 [Lactarius hatsudake]
MAIAGGNNTGVAPLPAAVVGAPAPAPASADRGPGPSDSATTTTNTNTTTTTDGPPPTCLAALAPHGQLEYLKLGNGRSLCFSRQSDDGSPKWSPLEAVLSIQGEPIALKHWPTVYHYGKSGQWASTKKNWANWRQELTEDGFWWKFCTDGQSMSYTAICATLKEECMAADRHIA